MMVAVTVPFALIVHALVLSTVTALPPQLEVFPVTTAAQPLVTRSLRFTITRDVNDNRTQYLLLEMTPFLQLILPFIVHSSDIRELLVGRSRYFLLETVHGSATGNSSEYPALSTWVCAADGAALTELVAPIVGTTGNGPFPAIHAVGSVQIRATAYAEKGGPPLDRSNNSTVFYDLSYTTLAHELHIRTLDHNRVTLTAVPTNQVLAKQTKSWTWDHFVPSHSRGDVSWLPGQIDGAYKQNHSNQYTFQFGVPGVYFVGLVYSSNAFDLHATRAAPSIYDGQFSQPAPTASLHPGGPQVFEPIAFVVPHFNGTVPVMPVSDFRGRVVQLQSIMGDLELCIPHRRLTVLGGPPAAGVIYLPLCPAYPAHLTTKHMALRSPTSKLTVLPSRSYENGALEQNVSKLSTGRGALWLISSSSSSSSADTFSRFMELTLNAPATLIGSTFAIQLAIFDGVAPPPDHSSAWQTVELSVVAWPDVQSPKHLVTAITDAPTRSLNYLFHLDGSASSVIDIYRRLGMSVLPTSNGNLIDPRTPGGNYKTGQKFYFPANRTGHEWDGLKYGIEHDTFGNGFNGEGFFCLATAKTGGVGCPVNQSWLPAGLSDDQIALELRKWENAVEFWNMTGLLDISYDGFLLNRSFENLRLVTSMVQPDYIITDAEHFPPLDSYYDTISLSANAKARQRPAESDCALAARIAEEFLSIWMQSLNSAVNCFYGDTPEGGHGSHGPWDASMLAKYGEQIVPQFGLYNAQASYPIDEFAKWIRLNKQAHQKRGLHGMIPWVTTGFDGVFSDEQVFEQAVHLFAGGATGFNVFSDATDGDWDSWGTLLAFVRATELVLPYEEIVAFGDVAYFDLEYEAGGGGESDQNVRAASAMKYQGQYLIALSPHEKASPMHVQVNISSSKGFVLHNLITGERMPVPAGDKALFQVQSDTVALMSLQAKI
eukprot:COSAG02_NODE_1624_length_11594_cov_6.314833_2_plen_940_part_00